MMGFCYFCRYEKTDETVNPREGIHAFYKCPICGQYEISEKEYLTPSIDKNKINSFMMYNGFGKKRQNQITKRFYTTLDKEKIVIEEGRHPVHLDNEMVNSWYPKTIDEKVDMILLKIEEYSTYFGEYVSFNKPELLGLLFVSRYSKIGDSDKVKRLKDNDIDSQVEYMLDYLSQKQLIQFGFGNPQDHICYIRICIEGYKRIEQLQKNQIGNRDVFVAMKYGDKTIAIRDAIKEGIISAGYNPIVMDEVEHNNYIIPEMLSCIRKCRFVVVDLTYSSSGAYFEEGYAMGLGKQVIQLCSKAEKPHFDTAQINSLLWESESEIPEMLKNRIEATMDL